MMLVGGSRVVVVVVRPVVQLDRPVAVLLVRVHSATRRVTRRIRIVTQILVVSAPRVVVITAFTEQQHFHVNLSVTHAVGIVVTLVLKVCVSFRRLQRRQTSGHRCQQHHRR